MITKLSGKLVSRGDGYVVLDVGGIGYHVSVPLVVEKALTSVADGAVLEFAVKYRRIAEETPRHNH